VENDLSRLQDEAEAAARFMRVEDLEKQPEIGFTPPRPEAVSAARDDTDHELTATLG